MTRLGMCAFVWVGGVSCGASPAVDVSTYPPEMQRNYQIFDTRCSRCHDLGRAINAQVEAGGWKTYVRRMARHPAASLTESDQRAIVSFLEFHHHGQSGGKEGVK